jgi:hypothetical protein
VRPLATIEARVVPSVLKIVDVNRVARLTCVPHSIHAPQPTGPVGWIVKGVPTRRHRPTRKAVEPKRFGAPDSRISHRSETGDWLPFVRALRALCMAPTAALKPMFEQLRRDVAGADPAF